MGISRAESLLRKLEGQRQRGTGDMPTERDRHGGDIVNDSKKLKDYQRGQALYAYMRLIQLANNINFQKRDQRGYMELNQYLYEISFGKPGWAVGDSQGLPVHITFEIAPRKPLELEEGEKRKTDKQGNSLKTAVSGKEDLSPPDTEKTA